jgi:hypothetical protein
MKGILPAPVLDGDNRTPPSRFFYPDISNKIPDVMPGDRPIRLFFQ